MPDTPTNGGTYHVCSKDCDHIRPEGVPVDPVRQAALDDLAQADFEVVQAATAYTDARRALERAVVKQRRAARVLTGGGS